MIDKFHDMQEHTKHLIDWASIATVLGTLMQVLPALAALFSLVWSIIRIYETKTVQNWIHSKRKTK
jgi:hypothetical protein